jgi:hypothetical protein
LQILLGSVKLLRGVDMDIGGWNEIKNSLGLPVAVEPVPQENEDVQFITMDFEARRPADILNSLGRAGLMDVVEAGTEQRPILRLIGQSSTTITDLSGHQHIQHFLTFEDLNHPNSLG